MKKKVALTITSIALVAALAIGGTLAWMTQQSGPVTNTFVAGTGITLELTEHVYNPDTNELGTETTDKNDNYVVTPGVIAPKDPTLTVKGQESWLFAEVVDTLSPVIGADNITINYSADWAILAGVTGKNGGQIYAYNTAVMDKAVQVFESVTYADTITDVQLQSLRDATNASITVYGYATQTGAGATAAEAWTTSFGVPAA